MHGVQVFAENRSKWSEEKGAVYQLQCFHHQTREKNPTQFGFVALFSCCETNSNPPILLQRKSHVVYSQLHPVIRKYDDFL